MTKITTMVAMRKFNIICDKIDVFLVCVLVEIVHEMDC
jgi:hypothetical protein